jgi:hypothetical protein
VVIVISSPLLMMSFPPFRRMRPFTARVQPLLVHSINAQHNICCTAINKTKQNKTKCKISLSLLKTQCRLFVVGLLHVNHDDTYSKMKSTKNITDANVSNGKITIRMPSDCKSGTSQQCVRMLIDEKQTQSEYKS